MCEGKYLFHVKWIQLSWYNTWCLNVRLIQCRMHIGGSVTRCDNFSPFWRFSEWSGNLFLQKLPNITALMWMFWGLKNLFYYCGDEFGNFLQKTDDFYFKTPGHTDWRTQSCISRVECIIWHLVVLGEKEAWLNILNTIKATWRHKISH